MLRHHAFDFEEELKEAPEDLKKLVQNHDSIPWRRKGFERKGVLDQIIRRAGYDPDEKPVNTEQLAEAQSL